MSSPVDKPCRPLRDRCSAGSRVVFARPEHGRRGQLSPKLHVDAHGAERPDVVRLLGLHQADSTWLQAMNAAAHVVLEGAGFDHDARPGPRLGAMVGAQSGRQGLLRERSRALVFAGGFRHRDLVAEWAIDGLTELLPSALVARDPCPELPRRAVPHVLPVLTRKVRDPVALVVSMKADDGGLHF
jgi:hypothetical protein